MILEAEVAQLKAEAVAQKPENKLRQKQAEEMLLDVRQEVWREKVRAAVEAREMWNRGTLTEGGR